MSGSTGADRVKSRQDFQQFLKSYKDIIAKFPGFVSIQPSGSYNSNLEKNDFGDIDLITHIKSDQDKATVKKQLVDFFAKMPDEVIVPFTSVKHAGRKTYNAGELVTVRYHDNRLGYSAQIDNIIALDQTEASFKQSFLDMPAPVQGLVLGLVKVATIETQPAVLFQKLGINAPAELPPDQEYEFNLSSIEMQLRKVIYEPGTYKQVSREVLWTSRNYSDLQTLLYQYNLNANFDNLLQQSKQQVKNPRSGGRIKGVFASMISVKSGEVGTPKGAEKEASLAKLTQTFAEGRKGMTLRELFNKPKQDTVVFAFGRFQPPTTGHGVLVDQVKSIAQQNNAAFVIYVSKTQDKKTNPLPVDVKMQYLNKMFPGNHFVAADATVRTFVEAAKHLNQTYRNLIMVGGSDRVESFSKVLHDYNGKEYQFDNIKVMSAGDRDPDSEGVTGMSGTKMREAAMNNDLASFMQGLPPTMSEQDAQGLMQHIQQGLAPMKKVKVEGQDRMAGVGMGNYVVDEGTSLVTTLTAIKNDIGEPVLQLYATLRQMAKQLYHNKGSLHGFRMIAAGAGKRWYDTFYFNKLGKELRHLTQQRPRHAAPLNDFLGTLPKNFNELTNGLPQILVQIGQKIGDNELVRKSQMWISANNDYNNYLGDLEASGEDDEFNEPKDKALKNPAMGQQASHADSIVSDILRKLPGKIAGDIRNAIARSPNKLQALQAELQKRGVRVPMAEATSAAVRLAKAIQRTQGKTAASQSRSVIPSSIPKKEEPKKQIPVSESVEFLMSTLIERIVKNETVLHY